MRLGRQADVRCKRPSPARQTAKKQHSRALRRAGKLLMEDAPREGRYGGWMS